MQEDSRCDTFREKCLSDLIIGEDNGSSTVDRLKYFFEFLVEHICLIMIMFN